MVRDCGADASVPCVCLTRGPTWLLIDCRRIHDDSAVHEATAVLRWARRVAAHRRAAARRRARSDASAGAASNTSEASDAGAAATVGDGESSDSDVETLDRRILVRLMAAARPRAEDDGTWRNPHELGSDGEDNGGGDGDD